MNNLLTWESGELWHLAGWTMLHFLWLGTLAGLAAGVGRLVLRRAPANVRYVAALVCLAVLAALPMAIAAWVAAQPHSVRPQAVVGQGGDSVAPVIDLAVDKGPVAPPDATTTAIIPSASTNVVPTSSSPLPLAVFALESAARYLPWLWLLGTPLTFLLLATGIIGAERLRRASHIVREGPIAEACARLVESLRIGRRVTVAVCERIAAPVLVGIVRPIILLPPAALTGWSPDEIEMVLLHELAHVRRWDNLINLAQRCIESLLFFHPAVWLVSNWVRREREACCDAVVVGRTNLPHAYAEMLVAFAARLSEPSEPGRPRPRSFSLRGRGRPGSLVSSAMAAGPLRSRIRRILQLEDDPMLVSGKSLALVMSGLLLAATLVVLNLPTRGQAEESHAEVAEIAEKATIAPSGTETKASSNKFPSLEDQKLADLAYRRLGWELESIGEEDLARVKSLGYEGGARVAHAPQGGGFTNISYGDIRTGDILVGMHIWPTTSLKVVAEILNRDDLAELNPLKFYVVRDEKILSPTEPPRTKNVVVTGRISVSVPDRRTTQPALNRSQPPVVDSQAYRYSAPQPAASSTYGSQPVVAQEAADIAKPQALAMSKSSADPRSVLEMMEARRHDREGSVLIILEQLNILRHEREQLLALERSAGLKPESAATAAIKSKLAKQDARIADLTAKAEELAHASQQSTNESSEDPHVQQSQNPDNKSNLLYDGKTFDEWRTAWQTELSTEKRLEVVKALAAFGANGFGREAAAAILDIAGQYDWTSIGESEAADALKKACLGAFGYPITSTVAHRIPEDDALPALIAAVDSKNTQNRLFATWVLPAFAQQNRLAADALLKLSSDADAKVRSYAFRTVAADPRVPNDFGIPARMREELMSNDPQMTRIAIKKLVKDAAWFNSRGISMEEGPALIYTPELFPLLFAPDESVRREARQAIRFVIVGDTPQVVELLLSLLSDDPRRADHLEAIRALAAMGPKASPALDKLTQTLSTADAKVRIASAAAIKMIVGKDQYQKPVADVLGEELGITVVKTDSGVWAAAPREDISDGGKAFNDFTEAVIKEQQQLFPDGKF